MQTQRSKEGYLLIDHSNSPGVSEELIRKSGLNAPLVCADTRFESSTLTCSHCNSIVVLNPNRTRERGFCAKCNHYICDNPICNKECRPFKRLLEQTYEASING